MFDLRGKHNSARVFADGCEGEAIAQIHRLLANPAFADGRIRIMPDVHAGAGCVIGFTATLGHAVVPSLVGVDIGCGVLACRLDVSKMDFDKFDRYLRKHVPSGFAIRGSVHDDVEQVFELTTQKGFSSFQDFEIAIIDVADRLEAGSAPERQERLAKVWKAVGTLGGGNHFVEIDKGDDKSVWLTIHSGSRNFGLRIATHHQKIAVVQHGKMGGLEYLEGADRDQYIADMKVAQVYAALNRRLMAHLLLDFFDQRLADTPQIESVHNYINFDDGIVRKGAISAHKGERVVIPLTMADGCIIGTGKGEEDWNFSAPHGAGRVMSRSKAKASLDVDYYRKVLREAHVWTSCVGKDTLDEAPMAYKRPKGIIEAVQQTVDIEMVTKPIYNFKAGGE